jgi:hypothetical protein
MQQRTARLVKMLLPPHRRKTRLTHPALDVAWSSTSQNLGLLDIDTAQQKPKESSLFCNSFYVILLFIGFAQNVAAAILR